MTMDAKSLAVNLIRAGAPSEPLLLLTKDCPSYDVEFAQLAFLEESPLDPFDEAILALASALGGVGPAEAEAFLGIGPTASRLVFERLQEQGILDIQEKEGTSSSPLQWVFGLLGLAGKQEAEPGQGVTPTVARPIQVSSLPTTPKFIPTPLGRDALARKSHPRYRTESARLIFLADPLLFLEVMDERRSRYAQHLRPRALDAMEVPEAFLDLTVPLGLEAETRRATCGLGSDLKGYRGQFLGVAPGSLWEVRPDTRGYGTPGRGSARAATSGTRLALAGFPSSDAAGWVWQAFLLQGSRPTPLLQLTKERLAKLGPEISACCTAALAAYQVGVLESSKQTQGGAFHVNLSADRIVAALGLRDVPEATYATDTLDGWEVHLRIKAHPVDDQAARAALLAFLVRQQDLSVDLLGTYTKLSNLLEAHWGGTPKLPPLEGFLDDLWGVPQLRSPLCHNRLAQDLVVPYSAAEASP